MRGGLEDTICAVATPAGQGGVGIIRLSGPRCLAIADSLVRLRCRRPLESITSHFMYLADVLLPRSMRRTHPLEAETEAADVLDEAMIVYMRSPRSFTGEDVVEIQSHGGGLVLSLVCKGCVEAGARLAEPGEFTKRAFLHGRLDLSQAEAVLDTIRANSAASLSVAQRQLRGELAEQVAVTRAILVNILAHVEAGIDFVEEDIAFVGREELSASVQQASATVRRLLDTAQQGRMMREGARVVIVGRPNVGKSSLLNALLKENRAIVTAIPGTTRDVIEEAVDIQGLCVHLVDTAGIHESVDPVEQEGIRRTSLAREQADLELLVIDGSTGPTAEDLSLLDEVQSRKHIVVLSKSDLPAQADFANRARGWNTCHVSAVTGEGIDRLRGMVHNQLVSGGGDATEGVMVTNIRHQTALLRAAGALDHAGNSVLMGLPAELIALDVQTAADALGEITGEITSDEILEKIFAEFCIGK